jgi:hypothetical protein
MGGWSGWSCRSTDRHRTRAVQTATGSDQPVHPDTTDRVFWHDELAPRPRSPDCQGGPVRRSTDVVQWTLARVPIGH